LEEASSSKTSRGEEIYRTIWEKLRRNTYKIRQKLTKIREERRGRTFLEKEKVTSKGSKSFKRFETLKFDKKTF